MLSRLGINDYINPPESTEDVNEWLWHVPVHGAEDQSLSQNLNIAGQFFSYFLLAMSSIQIFGLLCGEEGGPIKVSSTIHFSLKTCLDFCLEQEITTSLIGFFSLMLIGDLSLRNAIEVKDFHRLDKAPYNIKAHITMATLAIGTSVLYLTDVCIRLVKIRKTRQAIEEVMEIQKLKA